MQIAIVSAVLMISALVIVIVMVPNFTELIIKPGEFSVKKGDNTNNGSTNNNNNPPPQPKPDVRITSFSPTQAVVSELQASSSTANCVGNGCAPLKPCGFNHPPCNYGYVKGEIRNIEKGNATDCKIVINDKFEVDPGFATLNTENFHRTYEQKLQNIASYGSTNYSLKFDIPYPGTYHFTGRVVCANALSDGWNDGKPFHYSL